jgi:heme/copper-type cytochrome/quinol oxidase subunit 4
MKTLTLIVAILAIVCLLSTLICGLWMKQQTNVEASSINFHVTLGIASVVLGVLSILLLLIRK